MEAIHRIFYEDSLLSVKIIQGARARNQPVGVAELVKKLWSFLSYISTSDTCTLSLIENILSLRSKVGTLDGDVVAREKATARRELEGIFRSGSSAVGHGTGLVRELASLQSSLVRNGTGPLFPSVLASLYHMSANRLLGQWSLEVEYAALAAARSVIDSRQKRQLQIRYSLGVMPDWSWRQADGGRECGGGEEGGSASVVAGGDAAAVLHVAENDLDAAAAPVATPVVPDGVKVGLRPGMQGLIPSLHGIPEPIGIVAAITGGARTRSGIRVDAAVGRSLTAGRQIALGAAHLVSHATS